MKLLYNAQATTYRGAAPSPQIIAQQCILQVQRCFHNQGNGVRMANHGE
jgi:hypothetical protein